MGAHLSWQQGLFLFFAALIASTVDAIAGGGGVITLPALLWVGLPPHLALGTNKGQSVFGSGSSMLRFARAGRVKRERAKWTFPLGLIGSICGASLVLRIKPDALKPLVLVLLVAVAIFLAVRRPTAELTPAPHPAHARWIAAVIALLLGTYDGFFGPGTGTFLIVAFVGLLGDSLGRATAEAKVVNFASNLAAVTLFSLRGTVVWAYAIPMAVGQFLGGNLGAHLAIRRGDALVRRVVLMVVVVLVLKLGNDLWGAHLH